MSNASYRILIADDEAPVREAYRSALIPAERSPATITAQLLEDELFGPDDIRDIQPADQPHFDLTLSTQGQQAVEAVRASIIEDRPYAVAFLDVRMPPGIDGVAAAQAIRAIDPRIAIVLVTGYSDVDLRSMGRQVPAGERLLFLAKPFQPLEIQQHAAGLAERWSRDVSLLAQLASQNAALRRIAAEADEAKVAAERANLAKSLFLAGVGHELKTPLNAIIGFSDMIVTEVYGPVSDARYGDYAREINLSGQHLLGSINTILDAVRLDTGRLELTREVVSLNEILRHVLGSLEPLTNSSGVMLTVNEPLPDIMVDGDVIRLKQLLHNVIHNAVRFTPRGGKALIEVNREPADVKIRVSDTGVGIAEDRLDTIVKAFGQEDGTFARRYEGLGLGLGIAKRLAELHDGTLAIASTQGKGTTVTIELPLAEDHMVRHCA